jgi:hypothetical protein
MRRHQSIQQMGVRMPDVDGSPRWQAVLTARDAERWVWHEDGSATLHVYRTGQRYRIDVVGDCSCGEVECRHARAYRLMRGELD